MQPSYHQTIEAKAHLKHDPAPENSVIRSGPRTRSSSSAGIFEPGHRTSFERLMREAHLRLGEVVSSRVTTAWPQAQPPENQ